MDQFPDNEKNREIVREIFSILNGGNKVRLSELRFVFCNKYSNIRIELTTEEKLEYLSRKLIRSNLIDNFFNDFLSENSKYKNYFNVCSFNQYYWFSDVILNGNNQFQHRIVDHLNQNKLLKRFCEQIDNSGLTVLHHLFMKSQHPSIISKTFYLMNSSGGDGKFDVFRDLRIDTKYFEGLIFKSIRRENIYCLNLIFEILTTQFEGENEEFCLEKEIDWFCILSKACISSSAKSLQFLFQTMKKFHTKKSIDIFRLFKKYHESVTCEEESSHTQSSNVQRAGSQIGLLEIILKNEKISWGNDKMNFCCLILENLQPRARKNEINIINSEYFKTVNYENFTPLHYVVAHNHLLLTQLFLKYGADIEICCWRRKGKVLKNSVSVGRSSQDDSFDKDENEEEEEGEAVTHTPLSLGVYLNCKLEIIELLIRHGANISENSTSRMNNPLILALENSRLDIVELLFRNGVDLTLREDGSILHFLSSHHTRFENLKFVLSLMSSSEQGENKDVNHKFSVISQMRDKNGLTSLDVLNQTIEGKHVEPNRMIGRSNKSISSLINFLVERMTRIVSRSFHPRQQTTTSSSFSPSSRNKKKKKMNKNKNKKKKNKKTKKNKKNMKNNNNILDPSSTIINPENIKSVDSFYGHSFEYRESFLWKMKKSEFGGGSGKSVIKSPCFDVYFYSFFLRFFFFDDGNRFRVKVGCINHEFFYNLYLDYQIYFRYPSPTTKNNEDNNKTKHQNLVLLCEEKNVEVTNQLILKKHDWKNRYSRQENENYDEEMEFEINSVEDSQNHFKVHQDSVLVGGGGNDGNIDHDEFDDDDDRNIVNCSTDSIVFLNTEDEELKSSDHFMTSTILNQDTNSVLLKITFLKLRVEYNRKKKK